MRCLYDVKVNNHSIAAVVVWPQCNRPSDVVAAAASVDDFLCCSQQQGETSSQEGFVSSPSTASLKARERERERERSYFSFVMVCRLLKEKSFLVSGILLTAAEDSASVCPSLSQRSFRHAEFPPPTFLFPRRLDRCVHKILTCPAKNLHCENVSPLVNGPLLPKTD